MDSHFSFEDFSVELEDFELRRTRKFDRIWRISEGGSMCCIPLIRDGVLYFGCCNFNIYAVDAETGRLIWKFKTSGIVFESSPVYWEGRIFAGSYDHNMYALDAKTGRLAWKFRSEDKINSMAFIDGGRIYFASKDHNVYCLDTATGTLVWKYKTYDEVASSPLVHDGRVYIGSFDRNFYCLDAGTGELVWKFPTQGEVYHPNPPLMHEGIVYFTSFDNNLYAVASGDGKLVWKLKTSEFGNAYAPALHDGRLYLATRDGNLLAISLEGKIEWKFSRTHVPSLPAFRDGRIYVGFEDYNLYCLDKGGNVLWKFSAQGSIWLTAVFFEDRVIFPSWDCNVYCINDRDATVVWKFRTDGSPSYLPPANEAFEVVIRKADEGGSEERSGRKSYDFRLDTEGDSGMFYKSRVTYQLTSRYQHKGKYSVDSEEEEL